MLGFQERLISSLGLRDCSFREAAISRLVGKSGLFFPCLGLRQDCSKQEKTKPKTRNIHSHYDIAVLVFPPLHFRL